MNSAEQIARLAAETGLKIEIRGTRGYVVTDRNGVEHHHTTIKSARITARAIKAAEGAK